MASIGLSWCSLTLSHCAVNLLEEAGREGENDQTKILMLQKKQGRRDGDLNVFEYSDALSACCDRIS